MLVEVFRVTGLPRCSAVLLPLLESGTGGDGLVLVEVFRVTGLPRCSAVCYSCCCWYCWSQGQGVTGGS